MDQFQAKFSFRNEIKILRFPDTYQEFVHMIQTQFNLPQFEAEVVFADSKMQLRQEPDYRKLRKKDNLIKEIIIKDKLKIICEVESLQFYDYFLKNKELECCIKRDCPLCQGNGQALILESDQNLINQLIKQRLMEKMEKIKHTQYIQLTSLFQRYKVKLKTPEDFLEYHKLKNVQTLKLNKIQIFSSLLRGPKLEIIAQPKKDKIIEINMKNDGNEDWPNKVFFKCIYGPFQINEQVKSLKVGEKWDQSIRIQVPKIQSGTYPLDCSLVYLYDSSEKQFGEKITLIITVDKEEAKQLRTLDITPEDDFEEDFEEENKKLIPEIRSTLEQMGCEEEFIEDKIKTIYDKFKNRRLTTFEFFNEFYQD